MVKDLTEATMKDAELWVFYCSATPRWCLIVVRWNPVNLSRHPALCCPYLWAIVFLRCISPYFQRWRKGVFRPAGCRFSSYDPAPRSCLLSATHPSKSRAAFQSTSSRCPELLHVVAILCYLGGGAGVVNCPIRIRILLWRSQLIISFSASY